MERRLLDMEGGGPLTQNPRDLAPTAVPPQHPDWLRAATATRLRPPSENRWDSSRLRPGVPAAATTPHGCGQRDTCPSRAASGVTEPPPFTYLQINRSRVVQFFLLMQKNSQTHLPSPSPPALPRCVSFAVVLLNISSQAAPSPPSPPEPPQL